MQREREAKKWFKSIFVTFILDRWLKKKNDEKIRHSHKQKKKHKIEWN